MDFGQLIDSVTGFFGSVPVIRAILGGVLVFFVPGFAWSLVLFRRINIIERVALSIGLSIALVTLSIVVMNLLFGVSITGTSSLLTIIVITIIALAVYFLKRWSGRRHETREDGE